MNWRTIANGCAAVFFVVIGVRYVPDEVGAGHTIAAAVYGLAALAGATASLLDMRGRFRRE